VCWIADVRGKGLNATLTAAATVRTFRNAACTEGNLTALMRHLDRTLTSLLTPEEFVTATAAEFHPGLVTLVNSGHDPPILIGDRPRTPGPPEPDVPLGLGSSPPPLEVPFSPGERLLLHTDGIAEARDKTGRMFDVRGQAAALPAGLSLDEVLDALLTRMDRHTGAATSDDVALILCEPVPRPEQSSVTR
jgi:phosphoserine phosphatase RsbU/P